ncbi:hypothetical protein L7F22_024529 [Adiantum nelumboides]|nr:hypothetical protein [Adiantum nelumboides]
MSQATQQVLPTIDEETPFHKGDAMSTQEVVEHECDFVAQKPSNGMNKGSENMLPTIGETQIHEGNTRNSEEKMVVVENQSNVQTSPKPSDNMIIKDTYNMPLRDEEVEGSEKKDEANEEHQVALATMEISATKLKLASVAEDDPITRIQLASKLEAQESMQAVLGVGSSELANVPMLTAEVEFLADVVKEKEMQHNLLQEMLHRVEVGHHAYICPPPPSVMSPTLDNFTLPAKCAGRGLTICGKFDFLAANMSCGSSGRSKVFSRVKTEDEPSLERLQVVRNEGIGGEDHGLAADIVNLKHAAASVDVSVTATKVMIGTKWLENKVQDLSAANAEKEKVEEEEAEGDNVGEEAEQQELADANKDIAEVLEDLSSQGFSLVELDLGDDSPLGHFHKIFLPVIEQAFVLSVKANNSINQMIHNGQTIVEVEIIEAEGVKEVAGTTKEIMQRMKTENAGVVEEHAILNVTVHQETRVAEDSASNHMTNHGEWFKELQALQNPGYVETGDDTTHPIAHTGNVPLSLQDGNVKYLADVLHVSNITKNLVSIGQMVEQGLT